MYLKTDFTACFHQKKYFKSMITNTVLFLVTVLPLFEFMYVLCVFFQIISYTCTYEVSRALLQFSNF